MEYMRTNSIPANQILVPNQATAIKFDISDTKKRMLYTVSHLPLYCGYMTLISEFQGSATIALTDSHVIPIPNM